MNNNHSKHPQPMCFVCPTCGGRIVYRSVKDKPEQMQWRCQQCFKTFGPLWSKSVWGERTGVNLLGPKPWYEVKWPLRQLTFAWLKAVKRRLYNPATKVAISVVLATGFVWLGLLSTIDFQHPSYYAQAAPHVVNVK